MGAAPQLGRRGGRTHRGRQHVGHESKAGCAPAARNSSVAGGGQPGRGPRSAATYLGRHEVVALGCILYELLCLLLLALHLCRRAQQAGSRGLSRSNAGGWRRRGGWPWDSWSGVAAVPTTQGSMQCKWQAPAALGAPTAGALPARTHHLALHAPYFGSDHALALAHHLPRLLLLLEAQFLQERFLGQHLGELRRQAAAFRCNCKQVQEPCKVPLMRHPCSAPGCQETDQHTQF